MTYWGYQHSLPFIRKGATLPPLGLATLAAHLPDSWELRIHDLHLAPLRDGDLRWADAVLVSGMLVQSASIREVLTRASRLGKVTVLGGPAATTSPDAFPEAAHVFRGEAEGRLDRLVDALEHPERAADRILSPPGLDRPSPWFRHGDRAARLHLAGGVVFPVRAGELPVPGAGDRDPGGAGAA